MIKSSIVMNRVAFCASVYLWKDVWWQLTRMHTLACLFTHANSSLHLALMLEKSIARWSVNITLTHRQQIVLNHLRIGHTCLTRSHLLMGDPRPLSINTYGGTEIPVFRRCMASMIKHTVRLISVIKKYLYADIGTSFPTKCLSALRSVGTRKRLHTCIRLSPPVISNLIEFNRIL